MNEIEKKIEQLEKELKALKNFVDDFTMHTHNGYNSSKIYFKDTDSVSTNLDVGENKKFYFKGETTQYVIYREPGDNGSLRIDAVNDYSNEEIWIGENNKPLVAGIQGGDEAIVKANNNSNSTYLLVEPTKAGFYTDGTNQFRLRIPNLASDPAAGAVGDLAVVSGKLKICTATDPIWTVVGTQS